MPSSYSLGDHYETLARDLVKSGRYASVSEVLRDGMRLLEEREALKAWKLAELQKAIKEGLEGPFEDYVDSEDIKREGRRILAERQRNNAA
jgi:antitoxin ParD1/3/4